MRNAALKPCGLSRDLIDMDWIMITCNLGKGSINWLGSSDKSAILVRPISV